MGVVFSGKDGVLSLPLGKLMHCNCLPRLSDIALQIIGHFWCLINVREHMAGRLNAVFFILALHRNSLS